MTKLKQAPEHIERWSNELHEYSLTCTESSRRNKIDRLAADMDEFLLELESSPLQISKSSAGLQNLISRLGGVVTGDSTQDLKTAINLINKDKQ